MSSAPRLPRRLPWRAWRLLPLPLLLLLLLTLLLYDDHVTVVTLAMAVPISTSNIAFADILRSAVPFDVAASLEWKLKFARILRTTAYFPTTHVAGGYPTLVFGWSDAHQSYDDVARRIAALGVTVITVKLANAIADDPIHYTRDMLLTVSEAYQESLHTDSPLYGKVGAPLVFAGADYGADAALTTTLRDTMFAEYPLPSVYSNTVVGYLMIGGVGCPLAPVAATSMPDTANVLFLVGGTDCVFPPVQFVEPNYQKVSSNTCKTMVMAPSGSRCFYAEDTDDADDANASVVMQLTPSARSSAGSTAAVDALRARDDIDDLAVEYRTGSGAASVMHAESCLSRERECGAAPTLSKSLQRDKSNDMIVSWLDFVLRGNSTSWTVFNDLLRQPATKAHPHSWALSFFQSCEQLGTQYTGRRV